MLYIEVPYPLIIVLDNDFSLVYTKEKKIILKCFRKSSFIEGVQTPFTNTPRIKIRNDIIYIFHQYTNSVLISFIN